MAYETQIHAAGEPDQAIPPGEVLLELLEEQRMTQRELARRTGLTPKHINQLVQGVVSLSPDVAERLELVVGMPARVWNRMEADYRSTQQRLSMLRDLQADEAWLNEMPVKELVKRGYLPEGEKDKNTRVQQLLAFFAVASVEAFREVSMQDVAFHKSETLKAEPGAIAAWLRLGELAARELVCQKFNAEGLRQILPELRALSQQPPNEYLPKIREICAQHGVAVVFVKEFTGCRASGATRRLPSGQVLVQLSMRFRKDDHFWFTLFHELGHVLLHDKYDVWIEDRSKEGAEKAAEENPKEREADAFSRDLLIPPAEATKLRALKSKDKVSAFARKIGVAPGIVVGRLQHDKIWPYSDGNGLKNSLTFPEDDLLAP